MRPDLVKVLLPLGVADLVVAYTTSSTTQAALPVGALKIQISNTGTGAAHYIVGVAGVNAAVVATCMCVAATSDYVYDVSAGLGAPLYIRVIGATTTGSLYIKSV